MYNIFYIFYIHIYIYYYIYIYYNIYIPSGSQTWLAGKSPSYFDDLTIYRNLNLLRRSKP